MQNYVITISREFGSLGRDIAKLVAHKLNVQYYDRDLLEEASKILNEDLGEVSTLDESIKLPFSNALFPLGIGSASRHRKLFKTQSALILDCVNKSDCVIVGRCADFILKDYERKFSVMIFAPLKDRIINSINELRIPNYEVNDYVREIDRARDSYHKYFTEEPLNTTVNRDLLISSSFGSKEEIAELIVASAKVKLKF